MNVKETLSNLGIQQLYPYYQYRNLFVRTNTMKQLLEIANEIWYYLVSVHSSENIDLSVLIHDNMTEDEQRSLFWIFKNCNCCSEHCNMQPKSLSSLELIDFKRMRVCETCNCECNKACCYLHKSYHNNKYHVWI
jgi:hypothetical protein